MKLPVNYEELKPTERRQVREEYIRVQKGLCSHCGEPLDKEPSEEVLEKEINENLFPKNFFRYPVHLHHSHVTGMTIGVIHNKCNAVLWQYHGE